VTPVAFARSVTAEKQRALESGQVELVQDALAGLEAAADVGAEIDAAVRDLAAHRGARFAVRSSAVDEDGAESSFAEQLASYLSVDAESVLRRVADVWRSGFS
jgi:pyruvate,water dikinase